MRWWLTLALFVAVVGCEPTLEDVDGTQCTGEIPTKIRLVDYATEHPLPCSKAEAEARERVANADAFRENPPGVLCLLDEADVACSLVVAPDVTFYDCVTTHPAAPADFTLRSLPTRGDHCPPL